MLEAAVVVDLTTLEQSGRLIAGTIYLQVGQHAFPQKGWNDNVALILSWWLDSIANGRGEFFFMEGPFSFKESETNVQLVSNSKLYASYSIVWPELRKSIGKAAEQVIEYLEAKSLKHQNLNELKDKYSLKNNWLT